jgi:hypothetical protein
MPCPARRDGTGNKLAIIDEMLNWAPLGYSQCFSVVACWIETAKIRCAVVVRVRTVFAVKVIEPNKPIRLPHTVVKRGDIIANFANKQRS